MISLYENGVNGILADEMVSSNLWKLLWEFTILFCHFKLICVFSYILYPSVSHQRMYIVCFVHYIILSKKYTEEILFKELLFQLYK